MDKISGASNAHQLYQKNATPRYSEEPTSVSHAPTDSASVRNTCNLDVEKLAKELGFDPVFLGQKIDAVIAASNTLGNGTEPPSQPEQGPVA
jgi:hypothetical protein